MIAQGEFLAMVQRCQKPFENKGTFPALGKKLAWLGLSREAFSEVLKPGFLTVV